MNAVYPDSTPRVVIADENWIVRMALRRTLEDQETFEVCGEAEDSERLLILVNELSPILVVMGELLPGSVQGGDLCRAVLNMSPKTNVMIIGNDREKRSALDFISAGAKGYLPPGNGSENIQLAAMDVISGEYRIPTWAIEELVCYYERNSDRFEKGDIVLSDSHRKMLDLFARGFSYEEISERTGRRPLTIRNTIYRIKAKFDIGNTRELAVWAYKNGLTH